MRRRLCILVLLVPTVAFAQQPGQVKKPETRVIILSPSAIPIPALKYPLLPDERDLKTGNAALLYQRAHSPEWWQVAIRDPEYVKVTDFEGPFKDFPIESARKLLKKAYLLKEVDLAARRTSCEWEMHERMRNEGVNFLVPDVQAFQVFGVLLAVRARCDLADKNYAEAAFGLQTGFALARHVADGPILMNGLSGIGVAYQMADTIEDWVQIPGSPNLYWSLTDLPNPLVSLQRGFKGERLLLDNLFPGAREALADPKKAAALAIDTHDKLHEVWPLFDSRADRDKNKEKDAEMFKKLAKLEFSDKLKTRIREALGRRNWTAPQIDGLSPQNALALYLVARFDEYFDERAKLFNLPHWEAFPFSIVADEHLKRDLLDDRYDNVISAATIVPHHRNVHASQARLMRRIALLRTFEAIRLHAVECKRLPAKLTEVKVVPVPNDPVTGQPFDYSYDPKADRAVISLSLPETRYEISLRK